MTHKRKQTHKQIKRKMRNGPDKGTHFIASSSSMHISSIANGKNESVSKWVWIEEKLTPRMGFVYKNPMNHFNNIYSIDRCHYRCCCCYFGINLSSEFGNGNEQQRWWQLQRRRRQSNKSLTMLNRHYPNSAKSTDNLCHKTKTHAHTLSSECNVKMCVVFVYLWTQRWTHKMHWIRKWVQLK